MTYLTHLSTVQSTKHIEDIRKLIFVEIIRRKGRQNAHKELFYQVMLNKDRLAFKKKKIDQRTLFISFFHPRNGLHI